MKLWGGRFESGPSEIFERFSGSLHFDRRLIDADIRGSQAFARALERVGVLTAEERSRIVDTFEVMRAEAAAPEFFADAADEDVHTLVIRKLKERAGGLADKIHTGRSRNEQVSLDLRLWLREECDRVRALIAGLMEALLALWNGIPTRSFPAIRICAAPRRRFGRLTCWPILKCGIAIGSVSEKRGAAPTCCRWGPAPWPAAASHSIGRRLRRTSDSPALRPTAWTCRRIVISLWISSM